ncbi:MAG TPA: VWA domain-containing protein [Syntrophomonadaceae bacterium]|nr:VWA domain-containing protein [Syntrophomonadaceae bacterium]
MAGRDLGSFFLYRIKKSFWGLARYALRSKPQPPPKGRADGPLDGNQTGGFEPLDGESREEYARMFQQRERVGSLGAGLEGGKISDELPEDLNLLASAEAGKLIKKLVTSISRRRKIGHKRKTINVRATIHENMHYGGTLLKMRWETRKPAKPRVILILDTSSSMLSSAKIMLQFLYALQNELRSIEVFIFGSQINYVTPLLGGDYQTLLKEIAALPQWNYGGTQLWRPLAQLRDNYSHVLTSRTVVILLTDCMLYEKFFALAPLDNLRRKVKRLYLFNPDPRARDLQDIYYQETITQFKTVVDRMFYTETIHEVATALRQLLA